MGNPVTGRFHTKLLLAALLATSLTACGGGGSGGGSNTPPSGSSSSSGGSSGSSGNSSGSSSGSSSSSSSSGGDENSAPQITSLDLSPNPAYTNASLNAQLDVNDPDGDELEVDYTWYVNGAVIPGEESAGLVGGYFSRGDSVEVTVSVSDGTTSTERTATITIENSAPDVNATVYSPVATNRKVTLIGWAEDPDDDPVSHQWKQVSGEPVDLIDPNLLSTSFTSPFVFGELVFELTVTDSEGLTASKEISVVVQNTPPSIHSFSLSPKPAFTDTDLTVSVDASDADSQALMTTYTWSVNGSAISGEENNTLSADHFAKGDQVEVAVEVTDGELKVSESQSLTISDSPATISASNVPETAQYGVPVTFNLSAEDPDGEDVALELTTRPNGMEIAEDGTVTWTPTGPMFDTFKDVFWQATLEQAGASTTYESTIRVLDEDRQLPLARSGIITSSNYPNHAIASGDFNGDGTHEILLTDQNQRLYTVAYNGEGYEQNWMYPFALTVEDGRIRSVAAGDLDGDGIDEILVGLSTSYYASDETQILVIDGETRRLRDLITVAAYSVTAMRIADTDNDERAEIVALVNSESYSSGDQKIMVYDAEDLSLAWQSSNLAAQSDLAIGDTDGDGIQEIVISGGYIYGYNGTNYANEWLYGDGFGYYVDAADLNGNGRAEIVGRTNSSDEHIVVYDASAKSKVAEIAEDFYDIYLADVDGDEKSEILAFPYYGAQARLYSYDDTLPAKFTTDWTLELSRSVRNGLIADVDGDEQLEYVLLTDYYEPLFIAGENPDIAIEWDSNNAFDIGTSYSGGELANFSGLGNRLTFFTTAASRNPEYASGMRAIRLDPETGALDWSSPLSNYSYGNFAGTLTDQGNDGTIELLYYSQYVPSMYSFYSDTVTWTAPGMSSYGRAVAKGRINGDQEDDLVILDEQGDIHAYDPKNQVLLWGIERDATYRMFAADLDGDGQDQIIATDYSSISVYRPGDGEAVLEQTRTMETIANSLLTGDVASNLRNAQMFRATAGDLDTDGDQEIAITTYGYYSSWLIILDHNLTPLNAWPLEGNVRNLLVQNYGTGHRNILAYVTPEDSGEQGQFVEIDPDSGEVVSRSMTFHFMNDANKMHFVDTNNDGIPELSYGTNYSINVTR